jgi:phosphoenolpyruvate carboxykinase (ATP)
MFKIADYCERPGMVVWLQKDTSLPPVSRIKTTGLAVAMGASLSTMRAKGVENVDAKEFEKLVIEPFANPFRVHPLMWDCNQFKALFKSGTECYILNTHAFGTPEELIDIPKELTLLIVTQMVRGNIEWKDWKAFKGLEIPKNGKELFGVDFDKKYKPSKDKKYLAFMRERMQDRVTFLSDKRDKERDMDSAFIDTLLTARTVIDQILSPI